MNLRQLLEGTQGQMKSKVHEVFTAVGTDSRRALDGQIFFALRGENFDAHDFVLDAVQKGAAAVVVDRLPTHAEAMSKLLTSATVIQVDDTLKALQRLGTYWRRTLNPFVIGVTGTNGKTTTKEFTAAILSTQMPVQWSQGSFNNHWGVPISLLAVDASHRAAVIEMGMNHRGEIRDLVRMVEPDVVGVTMVGRGHLEGLGSIEGVAQAKEEIYENSKDKCIRVFNLDNPWTLKMYERAKGGEYGSGPRLCFRSERAATNGTAGEAEIESSVDVEMRLLDSGAESLRVAGHIRGVRGEALVPVFGAHNLTNLMMASCFALAAGLTPQQIWAALPECRSGWGRNQWVQLKSGARVLFDAYNANPESMRAAIAGFRQLQVRAGARKIVVLGEMREMGANAEAVHRELGEIVGASDFDQVIFVGPSKHAFADGLQSQSKKKNLVISDSCEHFLASNPGLVIDPADIVLMKGSRGMQLEQILLSWHPLDFKKSK